jgi:CRISPR-associated endonuclease/helicase Cas3
MIEGREGYEAFFHAAFGNEPFDYQCRLATSEALYSLVNVPTGAGKTAAILGAWLWRRLHRRTSVGRRLVYCLPMRTLVEQTERVACTAIKQLTAKDVVNKDRFAVHVLMGGEVSDTWDAHPERECILIGTQDMLLSRALNRGYAMSRFRWPVHFGLLNNDCLWVFDEIQLMGDGLATSTQLAAFREQYKTFGTHQTIWMSATLDREWLKTVDFAPCIDALTALELSEADRTAPSLVRRLKAVKKIAPAPGGCRTPEGLAEFVKASHTPGMQTLVVVNRVARARETFIALEKHYGLTPARGGRKGSAPVPEAGIPELLLLHSRFRPHERQAWTQLLSTMPGERGRIIVATQVIEAGVDLSSQLLITDLAPYSSLVQRFGRCNRAGEFAEACIFWVDRPLNAKDGTLAAKNALDGKEQTRVALPYPWHEMETARVLLSNVQSAAPADLPSHHDPFIPAHVLRRRDLIDLFDTTPDLSGYDLDISRFVRGGDERDVAVAWRELGNSVPQRETPRPARDELCPVSIGDFRAFLKGKDISGKPRQAWVWNALDGTWQTLSENELRPGLTVLLDTAAGGYNGRCGWDESSRQAVDVVPSSLEQNEAYRDDPLTYVKYTQTLAAHSREARMAAEHLVKALSDLALDTWSAELIFATHHHDLGKAHPIFQSTLQGLPSDADPHTPWLAKSTRGGKHSRPHFRHELASALALLHMGASDLTVYLAACHHGKVRVSIRALPGETKPDAPDKKYARGIWEGDALPVADLGDGVVIPEMSLDLESMLLGASANGTRSWLEKMIGLRDSIGVFRLAYLESLIRAADVYASANPQDKEVL